MKDYKVELDGKDQTNETEYVVFAVFVPKENREDQIQYFPFSGEWMIDLTNVREDTPLPTSVGYYGGRNFKLRKYVYCESKGEKYELVFTDSKQKLNAFVDSRSKEENNFLDYLREQAKKELDKIKK